LELEGKKGKKITINKEGKNVEEREGG